MKEISEEVYDIAKTLYDDDIIQYTIDRNGKALIDSEHIPDIEDYIYYYGEAKETDFNKALEVITDALDKVKFYDGYLELNDNHTLWDINAPEDNMLFNEDAYSFIVTEALEQFRAETDTDLYLLGRMGRHAVVDNNFSNLMRYDELKQVQQKYEQEVINQAQETCFYKEDLTEGLAKGEKKARCLSCGADVIYTNRDVCHDIDGDYIECPNCNATFDVDYDNIAPLINKVTEGKKKYDTMAFAQLLPMSYTDMVDNDIYDDAEEIFDEGGTIEDVKEYYINRFIGYLEDDEEAIEEFNIDLAKDYIEYKLDGWNKDNEGYIPTTDKSLNESELTESKVTESVEEHINPCVIMTEVEM